MDQVFSTLFCKMKATAIYLLAGGVFAPLFQTIEKYVFSDWEFIKFLVVLCAADSILGFYKAVKLKNVSSRGFGMIFRKFIVYSCALMASHAMVNFTIGGKTNQLFGYFDYVIFSSIMIREAISIFENIAAIDPDAFPKKILKYLRDFDSLTGELKLEQKSES